MLDDKLYVLRKINDSSAIYGIYIFFEKVV